MNAPLDHLALNNVLIVDDSRLQCEQLAELCQQIGVAQIVQCHGGREGLWHALSNPVSPDVIIVDLEMPDLDGVAFLQELVQHNLLTRTAVIIASARESSLLSSVEALCRSMGIRLLGVLPKPVALMELLRTFARYEQTPPQAKRPLLPRYSLQDIEAALEQHQFVPYFQPKVTLHSPALAGVEALIRWHHPRLGVIMPGQFIDVLEQTPLIAPVTLEMLELSLRQYSAWLNAGRQITISINLSARLIGDTHFVGEMLERVRAHGIDPHALILEVTETAIMTDPDRALANLARLRMKGFGLSIDDFGTGFASMRQLSQAPFTELKIDRSLVHDSHRKPQLRVVLRTIIDLARKLQLKVVAEGVEDINDWLMLRELHCDYVQGFLIARPMPGAALMDWAESIRDPVAAASGPDSRISTGASK